MILFCLLEARRKKQRSVSALIRIESVHQGLEPGSKEQRFPAHQKRPKKATSTCCVGFGVVQRWWLGEEDSEMPHPEPEVSCL